MTEETILGFNIKPSSGAAFHGVTIQAVKLHPDAVVPRYANGPDLDNALDLYVPRDVSIRPGETKVVGTGWKLVAPHGHGIFVVPRSGLSLKTGLRVANAPGLVDHGYRDEVGVILWNTGDGSLLIRRGDRIAQIVAIPLPTMQVVVVDESEIQGVGRGGGFGSTGT